MMLCTICSQNYGCVLNAAQVGHFCYLLCHLGLRQSMELQAKAPHHLLSATSTLPTSGCRLRTAPLQSACLKLRLYEAGRAYHCKTTPYRLAEAPVLAGQPRCSNGQLGLYLQRSMSLISRLFKRQTTAVYAEVCTLIHSTTTSSAQWTALQVNLALWHRPLLPCHLIKLICCIACLAGRDTHVLAGRA